MKTALKIAASIIIAIIWVALGIGLVWMLENYFAITAIALILLVIAILACAIYVTFF